MRRTSGAFVCGLVAVVTPLAVTSAATQDANATSAARDAVAPWIRPADAHAPPVWGIRDGIVFSLWPYDVETGWPRTRIRPRGLIRVGYEQNGLTAVTLNIWHDRNDWPDRLAYILRELRRLDPDVIGLQEVLQHETLPNQAATIARELGYESHFTSVDADDRPRRYGNAILTRRPVLARNWKALDPRDDYRTVAHVRIEWGDVEVDIYNTHLHHTGEGGAIRREQIEDLLGFIRSTRAGGPMILMGDFNAPVDAPELRALDDLFEDAYGAVHTAPETRARTTLNPHLGHTPRRIDHILVERHAFQVVDATIILDEPDAAGVWASDHFGVLARLRLGGGAADGR